MSEDVIMDFTGVYGLQPFSLDRAFQRMDCRGIRGTDCYCDEDAQAALRKLMAAFSPYGLHFLDSGNYHYMTKLWTDKIRERFSLVLFDHHTDMQPAMFEGLLSCGGWVKDMLDCNPFLNDVLIVGVPETDARAVRSERVSVLSQQECTGFPDRPLSDIPSFDAVLRSGIPIYVSIDKDVLSKDCAITNWDQGNLGIDFLLQALSLLGEHCRIIGMDVCGEPAAATGFHACNLNLNNLVNGRLSQWWKSEHSHPLVPCSLFRPRQDLI